MSSLPSFVCTRILNMATELELIEALKEVIDPELMVNIVDLGLIYDVSQEGGKVTVEMTLT
ncbi:MAG: DUF59 domain-containing protein, partial [Planctomycetaceae bacterium]|nr:DUF59 domain-containing protein [Planctomycetaceae bacterium]